MFPACQKANTLLKTDTTVCMPAAWFGMPSVVGKASCARPSSLRPFLVGWHADAKRARGPKVESVRAGSTEPSTVMTLARVAESLELDSSSLAFHADGTEGLVAARPVAKGEALCTVPESAWITKEIVLQSILGPHVADLEPWIAVSLFLVHERFHKQTKWADYVSSLPEEVGSPVAWSDDELSLLEGTQLLISAESYRTFFQDKYGQLRSEVFVPHPEIFPLELFSYDAFLWAACTVRARSHPPLDRDDFALVPVADSIQHARGLEASARWVVKSAGLFGRSGRSLVVEADRGLRQGDVVATDFAEGRSAGQILLDFGVLDGVSGGANAVARGSFSVNVALPEDDRFYDDKIDILELHGLKESNEFVLQAGMSPPEDLLATLRLLNIQGADAFLLEALFRNEAWEHMQLPVSEENESAVCRSMIDGCNQALQGLPGSAADDAATMKKAVPGSKEALATAIRLGEREALESTATWFSARLERLGSLEYHAERRLKRLGLLDKEGKPTDWDSFFDDGIA